MLKRDPKFVRDDDGQKAFSKLRSSIASSIYQWRSRPQNSRSATERPRVMKEAEFAFKQAFAYCPYSPEAVFHFMEMLLQLTTRFLFWKPAISWTRITSRSANGLTN